MMCTARSISFTLVLWPNRITLLNGRETTTTVTDVVLFKNKPQGNGRVIFIFAPRQMGSTETAGDDSPPAP
jgi:hypothetical protein